MGQTYPIMRSWETLGQNNGSRCCGVQEPSASLLLSRHSFLVAVFRLSVGTLHVARTLLHTENQDSGQRAAAGTWLWRISAHWTLCFSCQRIRKAPLAPEAKGTDNARGEAHGLGCTSDPLTDPKERALLLSSIFWGWESKRWALGIGVAFVPALRGLALGN